MTTLLLIVWVVLAINLLFLAAVRPQRSHHSWFELKRRDDKAAMHRELLLDDIYALMRLKFMLLVVLLTALAIYLWQWQGIITMLVFVAFALLLGANKPVQRITTKLYASREQSVLNMVDKFPILGRIAGSERHTPHDQRLESTEQLLHMVEAAGHILSPEQQGIIKQSISWHDTPVRSIMTRRDSIRTVKRKELLGPLVLDDLHRSGYNRFPVIDGSIDNIVGILNITDLLEIDSNRRSQIAEKIMVPQVLRIKGDDSLPTALKLLQKSHQHVVIVVSDDGQTEGMLTLTDITGSLLGH